MFPKVVSRLSSAKEAISVLASRNYGLSSVALQKAAAAQEPIQKLFLDKSREYYKKKAASKTGLVDASPEMLKKLNDDVDKVTKSYGASATTEFPTFKFKEPVLESIDADKLEVSQ